MTAIKLSIRSLPRTIGLRIDSDIQVINSVASNSLAVTGINLTLANNLLTLDISSFFTKSVEKIWLIAHPLYVHLSNLLKQ
jgi:hypothetical protein